MARRSIATAHDKGGVRIWDLALRVPVKITEAGALPRFDLKAKRWIIE